MKTCLVCATPIEPFIDFGLMPLGNGFLLPEQFGEEYFFPMQVGFCAACGMVQLLDQPEPERMFHENYAFFSGTSRLMALHFQEFATHVMADYLTGADPFVVEMGSNDGIMLQHFAAAGIRHAGIEPSKSSSGPTWRDRSWPSRGRPTLSWPPTSCATSPTSMIS
jgi:methylation protein EvaC